MRTKEQRQERIVEILSLLHQGGSFEEANAYSMKNLTA